MSEKVLFPVVKADEEEAAEEELVDPQVQLRVRLIRILFKMLLVYL